MRKPSDSLSFRRALVAAALAAVMGTSAIQAASAREMDPGPPEQGRDKDEPRGRQREGRAPRQEAAQGPRQDARPDGGRQPPMMAPSPGVPGGMQQPAQQGRPPAAIQQPFQQSPPPPVQQFQARPARGPEYREPSRSFEFRAPPRAFESRPAPPPSRIVPRLPPGHRQYYWGGSPYYHFGSNWYRPYGSSFLIVAAPFGLFVPYLPSYYTTVWVGGSRYYLADDTYYMYDAARRGYIVTRSPYGDDRDADDVDTDRGTAATANELFIYPMRGQSEEQQAEDRYQCHRWAADQVRYDPTASEYRAAERAEYDRAMTACLTGRGYSVK